MLGLRTTIYKVNDLDQAKTWYSKAFDTKPYFDEVYYVGYNIGGYELGLQPDENPTALKTANVVSYWGVTDIHITYEKLLQLGASAFEAPENVGGAIWVASVKDPFGNVIGLIVNPEFQIKSKGQ